MSNIDARITDVLNTSGLTVRNLATIANVHYTTIYLILKKGALAKPLPVVVESLDRSINEINTLVAESKLPLPKGLSQEAKRDKLLQLISELPK